MVNKEHPPSSLPFDQCELSKQMQTRNRAYSQHPLPTPIDALPWVVQMVLIQGTFQEQGHLERSLIPSPEETVQLTMVVT